jgi:hypothetical protein
MMNLTVRGCDEELVRTLKRKSELRGVSVNRLINDTLREALLGSGRKPRRYDDLDSLAGNWSAAEAAEFEKNTAEFGTIDMELWKP